jgi:hypothetical protein
MKSSFRALLAAASTLAGLALALPAFANDHGHSHGRGHEHGHGHKDGRGYGYGHGYGYGANGWRDGPPKAYERGYRDGYRHGDRHDDWVERRAYYPPPPRTHYAPHRHHDERIAYGSWFGDGYTQIVTTYYGRPCWSYSGWRGEWRRPYDIGYVLPQGVGYAPVPPGLHRRLPPPPHGYSYVSVDGDLLLIGDATRLVVDAILLAGR